MKPGKPFSTALLSPARVKRGKTSSRGPRCSVAGSGSTRPALQIPALVGGCVGLGCRNKGRLSLAHPAQGRRGEFLGCFYGLLPMHRQSWAPNNLLPLKALHSQAGWKDVKEKAMHMVKCKGARKQGGQSAPQEPPCPRLGARARSPGVWTSSRAAARLLRNGHKSWERR